MPRSRIFAVSGSSPRSTGGEGGGESSWSGCLGQVAARKSTILDSASESSNQTVPSSEGLVAWLVSSVV